MRFQMREPFSGLSHLAGALLSVAGLVTLLLLAHGDSWRVTSFAIYGASLILLYSASAVYHLTPAAPEALDRLRRCDHAGIFLLIAGSYTPVCLVALRGGWGWTIFGIIWGVALVGVLMEILWRDLPGWLDLSLYLLMGWIALLAIGPLAHVVTGAALRWLVAGGLFYTVGAVFYATNRPRLWPGTFGAHDLWHLFVLAGSAAHFMMMMSFAVPRQG